MKRAALTIVAFFCLVYPALADFKEGPIAPYGPYEASAVSAIVGFAPHATVGRILGSKWPDGVRLESLSTLQGVRLRGSAFARLKKLGRFTGADFSHGIVEFAEGRDPDEVMSALRAMPVVKSVSPNYVHHVLFTPNDPLFTRYQDNFRQVYVPEAWNLSRGQNAVVAVIDTGYRTDGMQDAPVTLLAGYDFRDEDNDVNDFIGHGTHVSNVIAERTDNAVGCAGIAYEASILPCKVFPDNDGGAYESDIVDAIYWAVDQGANVINMSLGGGGYASGTADSIQYAIDHDCTVFAASGNDGEADVSYPARYEQCVAVGATHQHRVGADPSRAGFSNYGKRLDVSAPGVGIVQETWSGWSGQGYYAYSGTSSACPHAAGVAALMVAAGGPDPEGIREALQSTAINPTGGFSDELGWGEIDAFQALRVYIASNQDPVAVIIAYPTSGPAPLQVQFDSTDSYDTDGEIKAVQWILDSKVISTQPAFTYTFEDKGEYIVKLLVYDEDNAAGDDSIAITADDNLDPCEKMLDSAYEGCNQLIEGQDRIYFKEDDALQACQSDGDSDWWTCLIECGDKAESCPGFQNCAFDECGITVKSLSQDDESSGSQDTLDIICGSCGEAQ